MRAGGQGLHLDRQWPRVCTGIFRRGAPLPSPGIIVNLAHRTRTHHLTLKRNRNKAMPYPNLLFLYTDEQRFDTLAAYGNTSIDMPHLNQLAATACVFDRAYVTQPVCTPSRSSLLTGLTPHTNGCTANNIPLDQQVPCLPEMLPAGRYVTAHFGKWHLGDELFAQHGFEHWLGVEHYNQHFRPHRDRSTVPDYSRWLLEQGYRPQNGRFFTRNEAAALPEEHSKPAFLAGHASRFIREHQDRPFCLYVNFLEPHMPFTGPRDAQYDPASIPLPDNFDCPPGDWNHARSRLLHLHYAAGKRFGVRSNDPDAMRGLTARYWGLCSQVDAHCGAILDTLRACDLWDDTIVVFTSDHGDMMGSHQLIAKGLMYEEAARVPLLIKIPGQWQMHRVDGPVSQVDLVPTLLELMDVAPPAELEGRSRTGHLEPGAPGLTDDVFIEWNGSNSSITPDGQTAGAAAGPRDAGAAGDEAAARDAAVGDPLRAMVSGYGRWKLIVSPHLGQHELFDLSADPLECDNVYGRPDLAGITRALAGRLRAWQHHTGDTVTLPDVP